MKKVNYRDYVKYWTWLLTIDITFLVLVGTLYTLMLVTGVVYPIRPAQQQLLRSWGIEPNFLTIVWLEFVIPLFCAIPVTLRLIQKFELWKVVSTYMIPSLFMIDSLMSLYDMLPLVIRNMILYPFVGWFIGQTLAKIGILAIEKIKTPENPPP